MWGNTILTVFSADFILIVKFRHIVLCDPIICVILIFKFMPISINAIVTK